MLASEESVLSSVLLCRQTEEECAGTAIDKDRCADAGKEAAPKGHGAQAWSRQARAVFGQLKGERHLHCAGAGCQDWQGAMSAQCLRSMQLTALQ